MVATKRCDVRQQRLKPAGGAAGAGVVAAEFLDQLALLTSLDHEVSAANADDEMVTLSSVHQAKGLEWKAVFVIWMTDGMFPSSRSLENEEAIEEERRLFYVAVTRARQELYLVYPVMARDRGGMDILMEPSRFIRELPGDSYEKWIIDSKP